MARLRSPLSLLNAFAADHPTLAGLPHKHPTRRLAATSNNQDNDLDTLTKMSDAVDLGPASPPLVSRAPRQDDAMRASNGAGDRRDDKQPEVGTDAASGIDCT